MQEAFHRNEPPERDKPFFNCSNLVSWHNMKTRYITNLFTDSIRCFVTRIATKRSLVTLMLPLAFVVAASAQTDTVTKTRIFGTSTVQGQIGGEAHDGYVIYVRKGQKLTVQLNWKAEDDNRADFTVSRQANFFASSPVKFGLESYAGDRWSGLVPRSGNYYIYVVAHPSADYTLKVSLK